MPSTKSDQWKYIKTLGNGSFGEVLLYQRNDAKAYIALKKCKSVLQHENLRRWRDEVEFMRNLQHPHIVQGLPVPPDLEAKPGEPPCLAMEFCSRGDLRKKLSELPNVCGLVEVEILLLAKHIASAMEYLHKSEIIHRDIKPENIMIQDFNGHNVFKLTDLGFAKDSKNQPATSFVGTREYMAPELYSEVQYTKTADYWSFGTVLYEIITGNRPFMLSVLPVVKWHEIIAKKNNKDIGYYENSKGEFNYARTLNYPHRMCRPMRESFEKLLNMLLYRDPRQRGGELKDGRPMFYHIVDIILNCKVIHVCCMMDGRIESFPTRHNDAVHDLHKTLSQVTGLPASQHVLLLANGDRLTDGSVILHDIFRNSSLNNTVYLYQREIPVNQNNFHIPKQTELVSALMKSDHTQVSENGFKVMWKQSIHYCHQLMRDATTRSKGFTAFLTYNLILQTKLRQCAGEMRKTLHKLQAKSEFFLESMHTDTQHYARQVVTGFSKPSLYDSWKRDVEEVQAISQEPEREIAEIERKMEGMNKFVYETQKNGERLKSIDSLQETSKRCDASFKKFKEENKVKRREHMDLEPIQSQIQQALKQFCDYNQALFTQIREVQRSCAMMEALMDNIQECIESLNKAQEKISKLQREKQDTMWSILTLAIQKKKESDAQVKRQLSNAQSLVSPTTPPSDSSSDGTPKFPEVQPNNIIPDSMSVLNQSMQQQSTFDETLKSLTTEQQQHVEMVKKLDWDFLKGT